ncbi:MAG: metal-dependent hydrolase [Planctomycetes bacterium]|nr:metal-dependent hydrolase [Planctomycetota bacterium]
MDSVSQFVLGATVCTAALGGRVPARRAALWGGVLATLPDLDVLIDYGDGVANMTMHRGWSHALVCLTAATPLLALLAAALHRERQLLWRWSWAVWLVLVTHVLLDALTIYGTRLWLPFAATPVAVGSVFVVDPLYTLPLLGATLAQVFGRDASRRRRWLWWGLALSTAYLGWGLAVHQWVTARAERALAASGAAVQQLVVTPLPFQSLVWRVVAVSRERFDVAYVSVFDDDAPLEFVAHSRGAELLDQVAALPAVQQLRGLAGEAIGARRDGDALLVFDLRMGVEPDFVFTFPVATFGADGALQPIAHPTRRPYRPQLRESFGWMWRRLCGERAPPPR